MATRARPTQVDERQARVEPADRVEVSCVVEPVAGASFEDVAAGAERVGLCIEARLGEIGVLTGTIDRHRLGALAAVAGLDAVEVVRTIQLPPPGSVAH